MRLNRFKQFISITLNLMLIIALTGAPQAARADAWVNKWSNHEHQPCPQYLDSDSGLANECRGSQTDSVCHAVDAMDSAANWAFAGATAYTIAAIPCWIACNNATPAAIPAAPLCAALSIAAGGIEIAGLIKALSDGDKYSDEAKSGRSDGYKSIDGIFGGASLIAAIPITVAFVKNFTAVGGVAAQSASKHASTEASKQWAATCASAIIATTMTAWKWTNFGIYVDASNREVKKLDPLKTEVNAACHPRANSSSAAIAASSDSNGGGGAAGGGVGDPKSNIGGKKADAKLSPVSMKDLASAAQADGGSGMGASLAEHMPEIAEALEKNLGVTPHDIASAYASGSTPADVLSKLIPEGADAFKELGDNKDKMFDAFGLNKGDLYANVGGGAAKAAGSGMPDLSALFGKKDAGGPVAGGVSNIKFGKDDVLSGDIWHIGTKKSIFEIVSDKWTAVTKRFMKEDSDARAVMGSGIAAAPTATAPATVAAPPSSVGASALQRAPSSTGATAPQRY